MQKVSACIYTGVVIESSEDRFSRDEILNAFLSNALCTRFVIITDYFLKILIEHTFSYIVIE